MGDNNLQFRASDAGVAFVEDLMTEHSASRTEVLRAMFQVASQFPDRIGTVLGNEPLDRGKRRALADMIDPVHDDGLSGISAARAKLSDPMRRLDKENVRGPRA